MTQNHPARALKRAGHPPAKFEDPCFTADGQTRATVEFTGLRTLWFNTGTLCNIECAGCYIESGPRNDRLAYLSADEVSAYLDEIKTRNLGVEEIGFTGGEPFMNPEIGAMLDDSLARDFRVLVLTNGMRPMRKLEAKLQALKAGSGSRLTLRVSLDHYTAGRHEELRGPRSWQPALSGLKWLSHQGFRVHVAGRTVWNEPEPALRGGYARLFEDHGIAVNADDPAALVLFPEVDKRTPVAEITSACWTLLGVSPDSVMCASSRMVVKPKGAARPRVQACTLLPHDHRFSLGATLSDAARPVALNHPYCAQFCVLGGGSCSVDT